MPVLTELTPEECERLLARMRFGRVGMLAPHGLEIVPVNYVLHESAVLVRTTPDGLLARYGDGADLVFEVDFVDEERWHGWSVVVRGMGSVVTDPALLSDHPAARSWVDGDRSCELRIARTAISGRKVGTGWDAEAALYSRRTPR